MIESKQAVIGVDIGGTKIAAHVCTAAYESLYEKTVPTPAQAGAQAILNAVIGLCRDLRSEAQEVEITAIGIGAAGQIHPHDGVVLDANENLKGWKGTRIAAEIEAALSLPVFVDNDVRAMALAEATIGAGVGYGHLLCVTVGTGIGGAIILNGKLWYGAHFTGGELGYVLHSSPRTIENVASGPALEKRYAEWKNLPEKVSLAEIARRAADGETEAQKVITAGAEALGKTLAPIMLFLSPQAVIIGGGVADIGDMWWQPFRQSIREFEMNAVQQIKMLHAQLGNRAGLMGAAILALQQLEGDK